MTRVLSELLEAEEPYFQHSLQQLEAMAGHPSTDIRLSTEVQHGMRKKIQELGLDAHDTTARELYALLGERLKADEARFRARIGTDATAQQDESEVIPQVLRTIQDVVHTKTCFALKSTVAKKMIKAQLPRKAMKMLGYRSADSMLKHESAAALFAAAALVETEAWHKRMLAGLAKLKATDFELRDIAFEYPTSKRWQALAAKVATEKRQYVLGFKELGVVVVLPVPSEQLAFTSLLTAVLVLQAVNEIRVASSYLRLHQMKPGFGSLVHQVVVGEPLVSAEALGRPITWDTLHQFFGRLQHAVQANIFEPLISSEELAWTSVEHVLAHIEPSLEFWKNTAYVGYRDKAGQIVACNLTDALLSHANNLPFAQRANHHFKESLRSEILLRYLGDDKPRQTLMNNLQMKLATETATI